MYVGRLFPRNDHGFVLLNDLVVSLYLIVSSSRSEPSTWFFLGWVPVSRNNLYDSTFKSDLKQ